MKKNFQIKYHFCVNPSQSDTAKISKIIFDNIKVMFFFSVQLNLCNKNLQGVIEWLENTWNKSNASFIVYDIEILSYQYHWSYFDKNRRVWCCNEMFWRYYNLQVNWCLHSAFVKNCFEKRERWFVPWGNSPGAEIERKRKQIIYIFQGDKYQMFHLTKMFLIEQNPRRSKHYATVFLMKYLNTKKKKNSEEQT